MSLICRQRPANSADYEIKCAFVLVGNCGRGGAQGARTARMARTAGGEKKEEGENNASGGYEVT